MISVLPSTGIKIPIIFSSVVWQVHHPSACLDWEQSKISTVSTLCVNTHMRDGAPAKSNCALSLLSTQIQSNFSVKVSSCFCNHSTQICVICPVHNHRHWILFLLLATHSSLSIPTASPVIFTTTTSNSSSTTTNNILLLHSSLI